MYTGLSIAALSMLIISTWALANKHSAKQAVVLFSSRLCALAASAE